MTCYLSTPIYFCVWHLLFVCSIKGTTTSARYTTLCCKLLNKSTSYFITILFEWVALAWGLMPSCTEWIYIQFVVLMNVTLLWDDGICRHHKTFHRRLRPLYRNGKYIAKWKREQVFSLAQAKIRISNAMPNVICFYLYKRNWMFSVYWAQGDIGVGLWCFREALCLPLALSVV